MAKTNKVKAAELIKQLTDEGYMVYVTNGQAKTSPLLPADKLKKLTALNDSVVNNLTGKDA